jgi:hypothetical protein
MTESKTTVRVLFQTDEGTMVGVAREGLVIVHAGQSMAVPWEQALEVLPTLRGRIHWSDCCANCGDPIEDEDGHVNHSWAVALGWKETNCQRDSWSRFHFGIVPSPNLESVARRNAN